jgi:hypothetical protein
LEVRRSCGGHPPVTERERDIRLNGICGVIFLKARAAQQFGLFLAHDPDPNPDLLECWAAPEDQEQDHDHEQELKIDRPFHFASGI